MPRLKNLSGKELIKNLEKIGFTKKSQRGSHIKFIYSKDEKHCVLIIPFHKSIAKGTLAAIVRQIKRYIPIESYHSLFYNE